MGRDTETIARRQGQTAEVRALLEASEIILRGGIRARVSRGLITFMSVDQGWLRNRACRGQSGAAQFDACQIGQETTSPSSLYPASTSTKRPISASVL